MENFSVHNAPCDQGAERFASQHQTWKLYLSAVFLKGLHCSLTSSSQQERKVAGKLLLPPSSYIGYESTARKSFTERDLRVSDAFQTINPAIYAQSCFAIIFSPTNQKNIAARVSFSAVRIGVSLHRKYCHWVTDNCIYFPQMVLSTSPYYWVGGGNTM